jgi:hypothetical protein
VSGGYGILAFFLDCIKFSFFTGSFSIVMLPHYFLIQRAIHKAWRKAEAEDLRLVPRGCWWVFGVLLRRYLLTWKLRAMTFAWLLGAACATWHLFAAMGMPLFTAAVFVSFLISVLLAILFWAVTISAALSARIRGPIHRAVVAWIISILANTSIQLLIWSVLRELDRDVFRGGMIDEIQVSIAMSALSFASLLYCYFLWRRWIRQGDAWFQPREE